MSRSKAPESLGEPIVGIHADTHATYQRDCLLCRMSTVQVSPSATPSRQSDHAKWAKRTQKEWDTDRAAYKRLRNDGLQPPKIDGSADLERKAVAAEQIETGHLDWPVEKIREAEDLMGHKIKDGNRR